MVALDRKTRRAQKAKKNAKKEKKKAKAKAKAIKKTRTAWAMKKMTGVPKKERPMFTKELTKLAKKIKTVRIGRNRRIVLDAKVKKDKKLLHKTVRKIKKTVKKDTKKVNKDKKKVKKMKKKDTKKVNKDKKKV